MSKIFILMLFAMNMVYSNQAMTSPLIDQAIIFNEEGTHDGEKDGKKNPEEDCE